MSTQQKYGIVINAGICLGVFFSNFLALLVPLEVKNDPTSYEALKLDNNWRIVYGFPALVELFSLIILLCSVKHISLLDLVKTDQKEEAVVLIKKIYRLSEDTCSAEEWLEHLKS